MSLVVFSQISEGYILAISTIIGEGEGVFIQHPQKSLGAAAMLDIGLAILARCSKVDAVALGNEGAEIIGDRFRPISLRRHLLIAAA